jgi:TPR repeat protein
MTTLHVLRRSLISLLAALGLLYAMSAEAKRDTQSEHPSNVAEIQTKAAQGYVKQELELAAAYFAGRGVPKDLAQAAYWYRKAADQGDPAAQVYLGYLYTAGIGVPQDTAEAIRWYRRAASSNSPQAEVNLASHYMRGDGVKQDTEEALRLLRSAADKGYGRADAYLGWASYVGSGAPVDHAAAEAWFKRGVKRHDPEAECFLAAWDANEPGHVPDLALEAKLLRLSATTGYVPAIHGLGLLLVNHPDLPQAREEANKLLMSSAKAGYWPSSAALGVIARDGRLVPKDQTAAYRWLRIAVLQGGNPAETYVHHELQRLAKSLTDTTSADQEAEVFLQMYPNRDLFAFANEMNARYFPIQEVYATAHAPAVANEVENQSEAPN